MKMKNANNFKYTCFVNRFLFSNNKYAIMYILIFRTLNIVNEFHYATVQQTVKSTKV